MAALAVGPFLYRSVLPETPAASPLNCGFVAVTGGLFLLLFGAMIWQLRRRRRPPEQDLDRRLWEAALGDSDKRGEEEGD